LTYVVATALLAETLVVAARRGWLVEVGPETGPVEYAHQLLCATAAILLASSAASRRDLRDVLILAGCMATLGVVRETDALLDHVAFKGAYKVPAALIGALALGVVWRARSRIVEQALRFATEPGFLFLVVGGVIVLVYAQIIGQKELWQAVMGDAYMRPVKDAAEELQELVGYALIFVGALETYLRGRN
jgi:hypothetical protein